MNVLRHLNFIVVILVAAPLYSQESVCDLFSHLAASDGKNVRVKGELIMSEETAILGAQYCEERYISGRFIWPIAVLLRPSPSIPQTELQQLQDAAAKLARLRKVGKVAHATVLFSGKLHLGEFGHLNAELTYDSFEDLKVETMADADSLQVISVCDLFNNLPLWRNQRVAIRGELVGSDEGEWIVGRCKGSFYTENYRWPVGLNYGYPAYYSPETEKIAPLKHVVPAPALSNEGKQEILTATFVGLLRMKDQYMAECMANGWYRTNGFGHLGAAAAEVVVDDVAHVEFAPAPVSISRQTEGEPHRCAPSTGSQ